MKLSLKFALMLLSLLAGFLPVCASLHSQDAAKPQTEEAGPVFKAEKYKEAFAKGKEEFAAGDYRGAGKSFKKALGGGKEKADKALVNKWVLACKGAPTLKKLQLMQKRNLWNEAYDQLVNIALPRYGETPLKTELYKLFAELDGALFQRIENFDFANKSLFSQKYGKSFVSDPLYLCPVGTQCLRWENTRDGKPGMLKLVNVPKDWSQFNSVEFWMALQLAATPDVLLMSTGSAKKKPGVARAVVPAGQALRSCLMRKVPLKKTRAWQLVRIPMASFKSQGGGSLQTVTDFRLQVAGGKSFNFLIDEFRLRRKNPKPAAGGARKR
tara:strand:+ start:688 stop:1665 length:978 start_codon:yes stop_codon:yes gene_type:complete